MKKILFLLILAIALASCATNPPSVRVRNDRTGKANVDLQPSSGSTLHIQDVLGGTTSSFIDIPEGSYRVHASLSGETGPEDINFTAENEKNYTVVIIAGGSPTMRIDVADK